jgi:hypothetical protein
MLSARDITLGGIASVLGLPVEVVELYEALFFSVRSRDPLYLSGLMFPHRLGATAELEPAGSRRSILVSRRL